MKTAYKIGRFFCHMFLFCVGSIKAEGIENIPKTGPVVLMPNHVSAFDPPAVAVKCPRQVYFMTKAELFKVPVLGWLLHSFGAFPVSRGVVDRVTLRTSYALLNRGEVINIFPEGTRSNSGELGEVKKGAFLIAEKANAIIVPVAVLGLKRTSSILLSRIHIKIIFGKPIDVTKYKDLPDKEKYIKIIELWKNTILELTKGV